MLPIQANEERARAFLVCVYYFVFGGMLITGIVLLAVLYPREIAYRNSQEARTCRCVGFQEVITSNGGYADMQVELLNQGKSTCQWDHLTTWVTCDTQDYSHCMAFAREQYFNRTFYCVVVVGGQQLECDAATPPRFDFSNPMRSTGFVVGMIFVCIGVFYLGTIGLIPHLHTRPTNAPNPPRPQGGLHAQEEPQEEGFEPHLDTIN